MGPSPGEVWCFPGGVEWRIHSLTEDGWVRYYHPIGPQYPMYCQPINRFTAIYSKKEEKQ